MKNKGYILALDASTAEIGVCIWDKEKNKLVKLTHLTLPKDEGLLDKAMFFEDEIHSLLEKYPQINETVIEEAFQRMEGGKTRTDVIARLLQMNGIYQYICHKTNFPVSTVTVSQCRYHAFADFSPTRKARAGGKGHKEQLFDYVFKLLGEKHFPTKIISKGPRKGLEVPQDFCMDMSDAYAVCLGFLNLRNKK